MTFQPIRNYIGTQHVLGAPSLFVHPNGNIYVSVIEQISGVRQDLAIYRLPSGGDTWEQVKRYQGTIDSQAQFAFGSAVIGAGGNMVVVSSLIIPGVPKVTTTGFVAGWIREIGIDAPYSTEADFSALAALVHQLEQTIANLPGPIDLSTILNQIQQIKGTLAGIHTATA